MPLIVSNYQGKRQSQDRKFPKGENKIFSFACGVKPYDTVTRRLTTGIRSEKRVVRRFRRCANIIECTYTNLDSIYIYFIIQFCQHNIKVKVTATCFDLTSHLQAYLRTIANYNMPVHIWDPRWLTICESQHTLWAIWDPKCAQTCCN